MKSIQDLAREAGFIVDEATAQHQPNCVFHTWHMVDEGLKRFAALVIEQEHKRLLEGSGEPLTDGRIIDISRSLKDGKWSNIEFARAIESAHGITAHTIETDPAKIRQAFEEDDFQAGAV